MADVTKTVEIIFSTTLVNSGAALEDFGSNIDAFAKKAQDVIEPLNALADTVKLVDTAIVGLGVAFGGTALSAAGQFNQAVKENGTLFGANSEQLAALKQETLAYAQGSTQSIEQINSAVYKAISSGTDWKNAIELVGKAEQLAVAGRAGLTETTLALTGAMNAYGAASSEAAAYSDVFMKTVQSGQTTLPELAQSLGSVASIAAEAKVPFTDLMTAIATITSAGVPTSEAMTAVKAAISNIIAPSKEAQEAAATLGIKFDAATLASNGLAGTMKDVYAATGGNIEVVTQLFGSLEALKAVTILGSDASGNYANNMTAMANAAGTTQAAFTSLKDSWDNLNQNLKNNLEVTMIYVGDKLGTEFSHMVTELGNVFKSVTVSIGSGAFDQVFSVLSDAESRIAEFLARLARNIPEALSQVDFSSLASSLTNLIDSLGTMFDGVNLDTPEGLANAIQLVVDSIATLIDMGAGIAQTWATMLDQAMPLIDAFASMSQEAATTTGHALGLADVLNLLLGGIGSVGKGLEAIGIGMEAIGAVQITQLVTSLTGLTGAFSVSAGAMNALSAGATGLGAAIGSGGLVAAAGAAGYGIGTVLNDGINAVISKLTGSGSLGTLIYDLTHSTEDFGSAAVAAGPQVSSLSENMGGVGGRAEQAASGINALTTATNGLGQPINSLGQTLDQIVTKTGDWADKAVAAAAKTDFMTQAAEAMQYATGKLKNGLAEVNAETGEVITKQNQAFDEMANAAGSYLEAARAAGNYAEASKAVKAQFDAYYEAVEPATKSTTTFKDALNTAAGASDATAKELMALAKSAGEYETKMEQIASNERIKTIEATMKLDIANVEANAKVAQSIMEGLASTYASDTGLIKDLLGKVGDGYSKADNIRIDFAKAAEERIEELHKMQMKVVEAQVDYLYAKTNAVVNGDPIMTINADGLEPSLEAFMWEVLKKIQVKMSLDGASAVIGTPSIAW